MLKAPGRLRSIELEWVKKIDNTMARYAYPCPTERQAEVITDIYRRFEYR
jgi:hypothetical protein